MTAMTIVRRTCASFVAYALVFLLARELVSAGAAAVLAYQLIVIAALIDGSLLWSTLRKRVIPVEQLDEARDPSELELVS